MTSRAKEPVFKRSIPLRPRCVVIVLWIVSFLAGSKAQAQVYEKVYSFTDGPAAGETGAANKGRLPLAGLIQGIDGNYYGTTSQGGASDAGTIYKLSFAGGVSTLTTLVEFTGMSGLNKGSSPQAALIQGNDGNFYGTTYQGGKNDLGTVFRVTPSGVLTTIYEFAGDRFGSNPAGELLVGPDGNFYGTTRNGGMDNSAGNGIVFRFSLATFGSPGVSLEPLVAFTGHSGSALGANPSGRLAVDGNGDFYGTTQNGGSKGYGTVYKMTVAGITGTVTPLVQFNTAANGTFPSDGVILGRDGMLYGTTAGESTLFRVGRNGSAFSSLLTFNDKGPLNKGGSPNGLIQGTDGNFYGTTQTGGATEGGTIFQVTVTAGGQASLVTLAELAANTDGREGFEPHGGLVQGINGKFYGTTFFGGARRNGTVFELAVPGTLKTVAEFTGSGAGGPRSPIGGVIQGRDGDYYGTTVAGGEYNSGAVYKITGAGTLSTLVEFTGNKKVNPGSAPEATLLEDSDGNFYGTTLTGGAQEGGTVFKMTPDGGLTTLVEFTGKNGPSKGAYPGAPLIRASDLNFYGTTSLGGSATQGTIFQVSAGGVFNSLADFTGPGTNNRGSEPFGGLVAVGGSAQAIYGTTSSGGTGFGTIFKLTVTGGVVSPTTLIDFTGNFGANKGRSPQGSLVAGPLGDSSLYGATSGGGTGNFGTIFKISTGSAPTTLTTLVEFGMSPGVAPMAGLVLASDGNFYGTTSGGEFDRGTVFQMTPQGALTTIFDFSADPSDSKPMAALCMSSDGNLYGTTSGGDAGGGSVYRIVLPGGPKANIYPLDLQAIGTTSAGISAKVNPRGVAATVFVEYGPNATFANSVQISPSLTGSVTRLVGTTLAGLTPGTTYSYRVRVVDSAGASRAVGPVATFATLAVPEVFTLPASNLMPTSAQFNGSVDARGFATTVTFEWGADGENVPHTVSAVAGSSGAGPLTGSGPVGVHASPGQLLLPGHLYYYRLVATNAAGTVRSPDRSFKTLINPIATVGTATPLSSTSVKLTGTVNARDSSTSVFFDFGEVRNGVNATPLSLPATTPTVTGNTDLPVAATVDGLDQGKTYYFQVRAVSDGGTGTSAAVTFKPNQLSGLLQKIPAAPLDAQGVVFVYLTPDGIGAGWRFVGEQEWRGPGSSVSGLASGDRVIEYRPAPGYLEPAPDPVSLGSGEAATVLSHVYETNTSTERGGLKVTLFPDGLPGAQWRRLGEDDTKWKNSKVTETGLQPGFYLVESKPVAGRATPSSLPVTVEGGKTVEVKATYFVAAAPGGATPAVLSFADVNDPALPYQYVGQIRSDAGVSSGFVVKKRVVATAAHVVFDDATLSSTTGVQWLFQRYRGIYEPKPQIPRGYFALEGYAAARTGLVPGESSAAAQNQDAAALYFLDVTASDGTPIESGLAGRGGFGGFLASDKANNEFLETPAGGTPTMKMLVGYPVDTAILPADRGRMYATPPGPLAFTQSGGAAARTYSTDGLTSYGGNSGGPLCVQYQGGSYYPAAIYLGGATQSVVRAIDGLVVDLFDRAEVASSAGDENTGGGVTQTNSPLLPGPTFATASLELVLVPATGGASWKLDDETTGHGSGFREDFLPGGDHQVTFTAPAGYLPAKPAKVTLLTGNLATVTRTFFGITRQPRNLVAPRGGSATLDVLVSGVPKSYQWQKDGVPVDGATRSQLTLTGLRDVDAGDYKVKVTWADGDDGFLVSQPAHLTVTPPQTLMILPDERDVTISPKRPQNIYFPGQKVTLTARSKAPAFLFAGWAITGGTDVSSLVNPSITLRMTTLVTAQANYVANPFLLRDDTYSGRIKPAGAVTLSNTGMLSLKLTNLGKITGKLSLGAGSYVVKGAFRPDDLSASIMIPRGNPGALPLSLTLTPAAAGNETITGTLTVDSMPLTVLLTRSVFDATANPCPLAVVDPKSKKPAATPYTIALQRDPPKPAETYPGGHGYGLATVKPDGSVRFVGTLGDGTALTQSGVVSDLGGSPKTYGWPFHALLYGKGGVLTGDLTFRPVAGVSDLDGTLDWIKPKFGDDGSTYPNGFTGRTEVIGARYDKTLPLSSNSATVTFDSGNITPPTTVTATIANGRFSAPGVTGFALALDAATGLFNGTFLPSGVTKPRLFKGVLFPSTGHGYGFFTGAPLSDEGLSTGVVEVTTAP